VQSSSHHHKHTNTRHFYRPDALPVAQPTASEYWRTISTQKHTEIKRIMPIAKQQPSRELHAMHHKECWSSWVGCGLLAIQQSLSEDCSLSEVKTHHRPGSSLSQLALFPGTSWNHAAATVAIKRVQLKIYARDMRIRRSGMSTGTQLIFTLKAEPILFNSHLPTQPCF